MKKINNIDQLDALFKAKLDKAEVQAPAEVWSQVASNIGSNAGGSVAQQLGQYFSSFSNIVKVALFTGGISAVGVLLYQANTQPSIAEGPTANSELLDAPENGPELSTGGDPVSADETSEQTDNSYLTPMKPESSTNDRQGQDGGSSNNGSEMTDGSGADQDQTPEGSTVVPTPSQGEEQVAQDLAINALSPLACVGETRTFASNNHRSGEWYINNKLVKSNSDVMSHRFAEGGNYVIRLEQEDQQAVFNLKVAHVEEMIQVKDLNDGQYELSLASDNLSVKQWYINGSLRSTDQVMQSSLSPGKVHISVELTDGVCDFVMQKTIELELPAEPVFYNIFTPDGDAHNDTYLVEMESYKSFRMQIFDAAGQRVFETTDPTIGWNGRVYNEGAECPVGTYTVFVNYDLTGNAPQKKNLKLTLKR